MTGNITFFGSPIEDLTREQLVEAVQRLFKELECERKNSSEFREFQRLCEELKDAMVLR